MEKLNQNIRMENGSTNEGKFVSTSDVNYLSSDREDDSDMRLVHQPNMESTQNNHSGNVVLDKLNGTIEVNETKILNETSQESRENEKQRLLVDSVEVKESKMNVNPIKDEYLNKSSDIQNQVLCSKCKMNESNTKFININRKQKCKMCYAKNNLATQVTKISNEFIVEDSVKKNSEFTSNYAKGGTRSKSSSVVRSDSKYKKEIEGKLQTFLNQKIKDFIVENIKLKSPNQNSCDTIIEGIKYVSYKSDLQMPDIVKLIQKDLSEPYSIYTYRYFIHNWPHLCFLAMDDSKYVGAIVGKLDLHDDQIRRGYIAMLAVDKNYRRKKIGSNLVLRAIKAMVNDDADEVVLETESTNESALKLYENLGFVRDKRLFRYYLNGVDALQLKLWLR